MSAVRPLAINALGQISFEAHADDPTMSAAEVFYILDAATGGQISGLGYEIAPLGRCQIGQGKHWRLRRSKAEIVELRT
jgi:hypothetical protein